MAILNFDLNSVEICLLCKRGNLGDSTGSVILECPKRVHVLDRGGLQKIVCVICGCVMTGHYLWMFCVLDPVHDTVSDDGMGMLRGDGVCSMWQ